MGFFILVFRGFAYGFFALLRFYGPFYTGNGPKVNFCAASAAPGGTARAITVRPSLRRRRLCRLQG